MNNRKNETYVFVRRCAAIAIGSLLLFVAITIGLLIKTKNNINRQFSLIDYNDSSYGDFYVISEKRTGKENIKILTIRDSEHNDYVIVLDTHTGDIQAITKS